MNSAWIISLQTCSSFYNTSSISILSFCTVMLYITVKHWLYQNAFSKFTLTAKSFLFPKVLRSIKYILHITNCIQNKSKFVCPLHFATGVFYCIEFVFFFLLFILWVVLATTQNRAPPARPPPPQFSTASSGPPPTASTPSGAPSSQAGPPPYSSAPSGAPPAGAYSYTGGPAPPQYMSGK